MWRRSWLSAKVLLFGLSRRAHIAHCRPMAQPRFISCYRNASSCGLQILAPHSASQGITAPPISISSVARPGHTPYTRDFLLSSLVLGSAAAPYSCNCDLRSAHTAAMHALIHPGLTPYSLSGHSPLLYVLDAQSHLPRHSPVSLSVYECRASASLLNTDSLRGTFLVAFAFVVSPSFSHSLGLPCSPPRSFAGSLSARLSVLRLCRSAQHGTHLCPGRARMSTSVFTQIKRRSHRHTPRKNTPTPKIPSRYISKSRVADKWVKTTCGYCSVAVACC